MKKKVRPITDTSVTVYSSVRLILMFNATKKSRGRRDNDVVPTLRDEGKDFVRLFIAKLVSRSWLYRDVRTYRGG